MSYLREQYVDKVENIVHAWHELTEFAAESCVKKQRFALLFSHTLELALQTDWKLISSAVHSHLTVDLHQLASTCANSYITQQCRVLKKIIEDPWGHVVLQKISNDQESDLNELTEYFSFENGTVIIRRLETLLLGKCADVAMRLSESCLIVNKKMRTLDYSQHDLDYILDIYISSLYDVKRNRGLITEIKTYSLVDGLQLLKRYNSRGVGNQFNERCKQASVWKHDRKIRKQIASTLLANAIMHENSIDTSVLKDLVGEWFSIHAFSSNAEFGSTAMQMIRKSVLISGSSKCIYPFCSFLVDRYHHRKCNIDLIVCCLIRAINLNMNEIEQHRVRGEREQERLLSIQLAEGFTMISELFAAAECENLRKECLLTAFSLAPSTLFIERLEALVQTSTNGNQYTKLRIGKRNTRARESAQRNVIPTYYSEVEALPVDETIKEDLHTILKYRRHYTLSWDLAWSELKTNCATYVSKYDECGFGLETPLRYLDLDYEQFKHIPIDENAYIGIEKGYEEFETAELVIETVKSRRLKHEEIKKLKIVLRCCRKLTSSNRRKEVSAENGCDASSQIQQVNEIETPTLKGQKTEESRDWSAILRYPRREFLHNVPRLRTNTTDDAYTGEKKDCTSVETITKKPKQKRLTSRDWSTVLRPRIRHRTC